MMLRFRQHIAEQQQLLIERAEEVKALVFNIKTHIPLSKKMMIRLKGGEAPEKHGIHITSIDQLGDLLRIQNSAKQISVMTSAGGAMESLLGGGVATEGGIWTIVHGYPVIESGSDFWSLLDTQGRRWIRIDNLMKQAERSQTPREYEREIQKMHEEFHELKRDILLSAVKRFPKDLYMRNFAHIYENDDLAKEKAGNVGNQEFSYIDEEWEIIGKGYNIPMVDELAKELGIVNFSRTENLQIDRKTKGWMIRQYYDGTEKILKKGFLDTIEDMMADTDAEKYGSWDEISMNDFEVVFIGVSGVNISREAEQIANSAGVPIDAMYSETAENPEDYSYEELKIEMKAQQYFAAIQDGSVIVERNIETLIREAVPPSERITLPDLTDKIEYVDSGLDNPDALLISLGGKVRIPVWTEDINLERYFSMSAIDETSAEPMYVSHSGWYQKGEFVNPFQYKLLGIVEGVATGIWRVSNPTRRVFNMWMASVEKNPQLYNSTEVLFGRSNKLFAYGIAIALGTFGATRFQNIIIEATDAFIENEEPDYNPSFYYHEALKGA